MKYVLPWCILFTFFACERNEVTDLVLSATDRVLTVGDTLQLHADVHAVKDASGFPLVWSSDNEAVAAVTQDGQVVALASGEAYITASAGGREAQCRVGVRYFTQARCDYLRDPYSTGLADLHTLYLATEHVALSDLSGTGEYVQIDFFVPVGAGDTLSGGVYAMSDGFTPPAVGTEYSKEYEKFVPYTLSPGFLVGTAHWGTWHADLTAAQAYPLRAGTVEVHRPAAGRGYVIRYDLTDGQGRSLAGMYEGEVE